MPKLMLTMAFIMMITACSRPKTSFSLNEDSNEFLQAKTLGERKVDILWVIDNSNSMETSQLKVADNFSQFINGFLQKRYDFQLAVTVTDAWLAEFDDPNLSLFRDGGSGQSILNSETPDLSNTFVTNVLQGTSGYGDERAFQSMMSTLNNPQNASFLRDDAFLAVIIVSDEDDFSYDERTFLGNNYEAEELHTVSSYIDQLKQLKGDQFSVSTMAITDQTCLDSLQNEFPGRRIGTRYIEMANASGGVIGSLCDDFSAAFDIITDTILELTSSFPLDREPVESTIVVIVDGQLIPSDPTNGWTYDAENIALKFHGDAIPAEGAKIDVQFDPVGIKE